MNNANEQINQAIIVSNLAKERTILAYARTSLTLLATGVAFQELFDKPYILIIGKFLIGLSAIVFLIGFVSFIKGRTSVKRQNGSDSAQIFD